MWGAIIGDLAGSIYEYQQIKQISTINVGDIISKESFYSDDTILTIAILDAILNDKDYHFYLKKYAKEYMNYKPNFEPYFEGAFSPGFIKWSKSNEIGNSIGNGAMMRISPVGYLFNTYEEVLENAKNATIPSHNSNEAIECATLIALIIYYARNGFSKDEIIKKLNLNFEYKPFTKFNYTCKDTINNCLYAVFNSSNFTEAIKLVISYGGDTDTNACIVGSMAEALYGIPKELINEAKQKIPENFTKLLDKGYSKVLKVKNN